MARFYENTNSKIKKITCLEQEHSSIFRSTELEKA